MYSSIDIFYMIYIHLLELFLRGLALWPSGLKPLTLLLFPSPECWDYRQAPPHWPVFSLQCGTRKTSTTQCFCPHNLQMLQICSYGAPNPVTKSGYMKGGARKCE